MNLVLKNKIELLFKRNQIILAKDWHLGYGSQTSSSNRAGKCVDDLPLEATCSDSVSMAEAARLLQTSTNQVSRLIDVLGISAQKQTNKILISPEGYERMARYRTTIYYSMIARWLYFSRFRADKDSLIRVEKKASSDPLIEKIYKSVWN